MDAMFMQKLVERIYVTSQQYICKCDYNVRIKINNNSLICKTFS